MRPMDSAQGIKFFRPEIFHALGTVGVGQVAVLGHDLAFERPLGPEIYPDARAIGPSSRMGLSVPDGVSECTTDTIRISGCASR